MGFFANIVADSHYMAQRLEGSSAPNAVSGVADAAIPEEPRQPNQSQSVAKQDVMIGQEVGFDAAVTRGVERPLSAQAIYPSQSPGPVASPVARNLPDSQPTQTTMPAVPNTAGVSQIQQMSAQRSPLPAVETVTHPAAIKQAKVNHPDLATPAEMPAVGEGPVRHEPVHRIDVSSPSVMEGEGVDQPLDAPPSPLQTSNVAEAQEGDDRVISKGVTPSEIGSRAQSASADERATSAPVVAAVVKQISPSGQPVAAQMIAPPRATSASKATPPQVRIGQVNVIVEAPAKPGRAAVSTSVGNDLASRTFLRSL
jgi:hypothetical protein